MKKFLVVLGSIFLALIVLGAIGLVFLDFWGKALDKESKAYADSAIPAIVTTWSEKALLDRASPEFKKAVTLDQLDGFFRWISALGRLQKCESAQGQSLTAVTPQKGKEISAQYTAKATFERGQAQVRLGLIKHGDEWQITRFDIQSPQLRPKKPNQAMQPTTGRRTAQISMTRTSPPAAMRALARGG